MKTQQIEKFHSELKKYAPECLSWATEIFEEHTQRIIESKEWQHLFKENFETAKTLWICTKATHELFNNGGCNVNFDRHEEESIDDEEPYNIDYLDLYDKRISDEHIDEKLLIMYQWWNSLIDLESNN